MKRKAKKGGVAKRKGKALGRGEMKKVSGGWGYLHCEREYDIPPGPDGDDSIIGRQNLRRSRSG
jgi:hypothetical protein